MFNKYIVTTTVSEPSEALRAFASKKDWHLIVVGDQKTPHNSYKNFPNTTYLHPDEQKKKYKSLSDAIQWNTIDRRNLGFIEAYKRGAKIIASVDDDNIPHEDWGKQLFVNEEVEVEVFDTTQVVFDPLFVTNHSELWHRGFPIQLLSKRDALSTGLKK